MSLHWPALSPWQLVLVAGAIAQVTKFLVYGAANRRFHLRALVVTNGLPSLYGVVFAALCTTVVLDRGMADPLSSATLIFSGIVLHDIVRVKGSVDRGGRAALVVARNMAHTHRARWERRALLLLRDRRHRPLHVAVGVALGIAAGLGWHPR